MWNVASARLSYRRRRVGITGCIRRLACVLHLALEVRRERRMLLTMDERALKDIGFSRSKVYAEAHRWFWDLPSDRLCL